VQRGQRIHESVFELVENGYTPLALLHDEIRWQDISQMKGELIEPDLFTNAKSLMNVLTEKSEVSEEDSQALLILLTLGK
jgi:hypothetical protein